MLKQLWCFLAKNHKDRRYIGSLERKQVDLDEFRWFKHYVCKNCGYKGKEYV